MEHSQRLKRVLPLLALWLACPTVAQEDEGRAYFSLSTQRTFGPGEAASIQMWGSGFDALEFRMYRVNDPVKFFERLEDHHRFGEAGGAPRAGQAKTALERMRSWKQRWRSRLQNTARAQFTSDSRHSLREWRTSSSAPAQNAAAVNVQRYADVPVLNAQQLVARWEHKHRAANRWDSASVAIPPSGKGLFLIEATDGRAQAYTIVSVTDLAAITKAAPGRLLTRVVKRESGEPLKDVPVTVMAGTGKEASRSEGRTDANGVFELPVKADGDAKARLVLARQGSDMAAVSVGGYALSNSQAERISAYIYTDRPVYRPGHTVYYRAVLRDPQDRGYQVPAPAEYQIEIQDAEGNSVHRERKKSSPMGTLNGEVKLPPAAGLGYYNVQLKLGDNTHSGGFHVEEYKKPEYSVRVTTDTPRVLQGAKIQATIDARYFYGEPVAKAKVKYAVHKSRYWVPYYMDELEDESGGGDSEYTEREQVLEEEGELDADGKLRIEVPAGEADHDLQYRIEGRVTDAAGREISGAGFVVATVGP